MEKEFVPYELAVKLKELGFDKSTFGGWCHPFNNHKPYLQLNQEGEYDITAPTFSQAFRWFREMYNVYAIILPSYADDKVIKNRFFYEIADGNKLKQELDYHSAYEEAELACLEKLIEIIESKSE